MARTATAKYYTYGEWRDYESDASRRSAARSAARAARAAEPGRAAVSRGGRTAARAGGATSRSARPAHAGARPVVRSRPRTKARRLPYLFAAAFLLCALGVCCVMPAVLNTAALHYKASAAQMQRETAALQKEAADLVAEQAELGATARVKEVATRMGLEPALAVTYVSVPADSSGMRAAQTQDEAPTGTAQVRLASRGEQPGSTQSSP